MKKDKKCDVCESQAIKIKKYEFPIDGTYPYKKVSISLPNLCKKHLLPLFFYIINRI